jgi:glycosyltransferase involved in cell wall biosynthesis
VCEQCKGGKLHNVARKRCIKGSLSLSSIIMIEAVVHKLLRSYECNVDRFLSPCRFYIDKLVEWGWPRERFTHIPNFVDTAELVPEPKPGDSFLYFGRLSPEKGLLTLMRATAAAGVHLRVVGDGPQLGLLQREAANARAKVTFVGRLSGEALLDEIRQARASVLAAEWYENAPMSILESYALGKTVIGAAIGGIPELIREGLTGWMFSSTSVDELAGVLQKVASMPDAELAEMGMNARRLVETEYSLPRYQQRILDVYAGVGARA